MLKILSSLMIPFMVLLVLIYGILKKIDVYDVFIDGAKESFGMILELLPTLLGMILGINIFLKSGVLEFVLKGFGPFFHYLKVPLEIVPMAIMRPISGSSTLAILNNIYETFGPDGYLGTLASVIQGSTDTTFYVLTLYFGSIGIKKIRYAMWAGLCADLIGIIASITIVNLLF
ncbi:MAG: spore maturation protein [Bacilli bacterium]|nr:spore maturation protein [Bacilli bacterium]